jgi:hypothetical protein
MLTAITDMSGDWFVLGLSKVDDSNSSKAAVWFTRRHGNHVEIAWTWGFLSAYILRTTATLWSLRKKVLVVHETTRQSLENQHGPRLLCLEYSRMTARVVSGKYSDEPTAVAVSFEQRQKRHHRTRLNWLAYLMQPHWLLQNLEALVSTQTPCYPTARFLNLSAFSSLALSSKQVTSLSLSAASGARSPSSYYFWNASDPLQICKLQIKLIFVAAHPLCHVLVYSECQLCQSRESWRVMIHCHPLMMNQKQTIRIILYCHHLRNIVIFQSIRTTRTTPPGISITNVYNQSKFFGDCLNISLVWRLSFATFRQYPAFSWPCQPAAFQPSFLTWMPTFERSNNTSNININESSTSTSNFVQAILWLTRLFP